MILVAPPQAPTGANPLRYVLLCEDAAFILSVNEAVRTQQTGQVEFVTWDHVGDADRTRAINAIRQEQALEARMAGAA